MRLSFKLVAILLACGCATAARQGGQPAGDGRVSSPGGTVHFEYQVAHGEVRYRVLHGAGEVLSWSPLGIARADEDFRSGLTLTGTTSRPVIEEYDLRRGKRSHYLNRGVEQTLSFRNGHGARVDLEVRVFDDGFGFRYRFPQTDARRLTVTEEATGFRPPTGTRAFISPHDHINGGRAAYQSPYVQDMPAGTAAPHDYGWSFPALFRTGEGKVLLLTEAGLDASYCGTHLAPRADGGVYRIAFPHPAEARGVGAVNPSSTLPWATPWRVGIVGDRLATIVESNLVTDLAAPAVIADAGWVKPGRASWSWWSDELSPRSYARVVPFIDLAAAFHWEYSLVDEGWPTMEGGTWQALARYAATKNVGLLFWYESGVRRPDPRSAPMYQASTRREELARIAAAGARGIKVDFFESDKQDTIALYLGILEDAAASKLMVDFHGSTLPRGWERTYPNLMSLESVRGAEMYQFDAAFAQYAPTHNTMMVFSRNVVGPMDYTPVTFSHVKNRHHTSWGHELGLSVVFESGLQHLADAADSYRALPVEARDFLTTVPAAWDETRFLEGEPGKLAVLARRLGRTWYVGGINGEASIKKVAIPTEFLGNGTFDMLLLADGRTESSFLVTRRQRNATDTQSVELRPYGGFAIRFVPLN
jgi:alpha-glucosidase